MSGKRGTNVSLKSVIMILVTHRLSVTALVVDFALVPSSFVVRVSGPSSSVLIPSGGSNRRALGWSLTWRS